MRFRFVYSRISVCSLFFDAAFDFANIVQIFPGEDADLSNVSTTYSNLSLTQRLKSVSSKRHEKDDGDWLLHKEWILCSTVYSGVIKNKDFRKIIESFEHQRVNFKSVWINGGFWGVILRSLQKMEADSTSAFDWACYHETIRIWLTLKPCSWICWQDDEQRLCE